MEVHGQLSKKRREESDGRARSEIEVQSHLLFVKNAPKDSGSFVDFCSQDCTKLFGIEEV